MWLIKATVLASYPQQLQCIDFVSLQLFLSENYEINPHSLTKTSKTCRSVLTSKCTEQSQSAGVSAVLCLFQQLLERLTQPEWCDVTCDGFYVILNDYDVIMTPAMHANVKLMYRQRFFHMVLPKLIKQFVSVEDGK